MLSTRFHCLLHPIYTSHIAYQQREFQMFCITLCSSIGEFCNFCLRNIRMVFIFEQCNFISCSFSNFRNQNIAFQSVWPFFFQIFPITPKEPGVYIMQTIFTAIAFLDYFHLFLLKWTFAMIKRMVSECGPTRGTT